MKAVSWLALAGAIVVTAPAAPAAAQYVDPDDDLGGEERRAPQSVGGGPELGFSLGVHAISSNTTLTRDDAVSMSSTPVTGIPLGLRLGIPIGDLLRLEFEGTAQYATTGDNLGNGVVFGWRGLVRFRFTGQRSVFRPFLLAGGGGHSAIIARPLTTDRDTVYGGTFGGGLELGLNRRWAMRVDGRAHVSPGADGLATSVEVLFGFCWGACGYAAPGEIIGRTATTTKPARDTDEDGFYGDSDLCPLRAEDVDGFKDDDGCPDSDDDGDGIDVPDDACPTEAETQNGYKDADGCPDQFPEALAVFEGIVAGIVFRPGTAVFDQRSFDVLDALAQGLLAHAEIKVKIVCHTSSAGEPEVLMKLSEDRAEAVRQYLVDKGVDTARIESSGVGGDTPLASNDSAEGRAINERIEIRFAE